MARPIITLTTDFGLSDHFVASMKGVILGLLPNADIVDISHQVGAYNISEAAFVISQAYADFPKKTVHVVVVDPGVGTSRRPILVSAAGQFFIAPDNGVLSMVYSREKHAVRAITNAKYFRQPLSETFHGRDIFAPCAARLAKGASPASFGKLFRDYVQLALDEPARTGARSWSGTVLKADRFGNLITNFRISEFPVVFTRPFRFAAGGHEITEMARTFADFPEGEVFVLVGSAGFLEISMNQGSAAEQLGVGTGAPVDLTIY